jgi:hypothetical protein
MGTYEAMAASPAIRNIDDVWFQSRRRLADETNKTIRT